MSVMRVRRRAGAVVRFARCPYCHGAVVEGREWTCARCRAPHHDECYREHGGCSVFGCERGEDDECSAEPVARVLPRPAPRRSERNHPLRIAAIVAGAVLPHLALEASVPTPGTVVKAVLVAGTVAVVWLWRRGERWSLVPTVAILAVFAIAAALAG